MIKNTPHNAVEPQSVKIINHNPHSISGEHVNTKVIVMAMTFLTLVLVATGASAIASAQYLSGDALDQSGYGFIIDERIHPKIPNPYTYHKEMAVPSNTPFVTLLIMGVAASAIASTFFIKGRSGRHAAVGDGSCQKSAIK